MLSEQSKATATRLSAPHLKNPTLRAAIEESVGIADETGYYMTEFALLDNTIKGVNSLLKTPLSSGRDSDLINIYDSQPTMTALPEPFAWIDRTERHKWNNFLTSTFATLNDEISDRDHPHRGYPDPLTINEGNPQDVFRFFLWDGYARWRAKMIVQDNLSLAPREEDIANMIVNSLCEATVVAAEKGDKEMIKAIQWLENRNWLDPKWGYSENFGTRAKHVIDSAKKDVKQWRLFEQDLGRRIKLKTPILNEGDGYFFKPRIVRNPDGSLVSMYLDKAIAIGDQSQTRILVSQRYATLYHIHRHGELFRDPYTKIIVSTYGSGYNNENEIIGHQIKTQFMIPFINSVSTYGVIISENSNSIKGSFTRSSDMTISLTKHGLATIRDNLLKPLGKFIDIKQGGALKYDTKSNRLVLSAYPLDIGQTTFPISLEELKGLPIDGIPDTIAYNEPCLEFTFTIGNKKVEIKLSTEPPNDLKKSILSNNPLIPFLVNISNL